MSLRFKTDKGNPPPLSLCNQYLEDVSLREIVDLKIHKRLSEENSLRQQIEQDLTRFGDRVTKDIWEWAKEAEENVPKLVQYDNYQNRIDTIITTQGWKNLNAVSATEQLIALGYNPQLRQLGVGRVYQFVKLYLFNPSSAVATCPLAMCDGAARLVESIGDEDLKREVFPRLTSTDPNYFWTSGQWMTEKKGGSDVQYSTETIAVPIQNDSPWYHLYGFKWFTSATESQMTFALARIADPTTGKPVDGKLSLFYVPMRDSEGKLNGLKIHKMKNKLGTKALPTCELSLKQTRAKLVGEVGRGVNGISYMLNITRTYNSICAVSAMRRVISLARDWATKRKAFGSLLIENDLHLQTLAKMEVETHGCLIFVMEIVDLLGKEESKTATPIELDILRLFTPIIKLYTGKMGVAISSEGMEAIGGNAYMEDSHVPEILRNAQVLAIWEGTTNILSSDVLRALTKNPSSLVSFKKRVLSILSLQNENCPYLKHVQEQVDKAMNDLLSKLTKNSSNKDYLTVYARELSFSLARIFIAALLYEHTILHHQLKPNEEKSWKRNRIMAYAFVKDHSPLCTVPDASTTQDAKQNAKFISQYVQDITSGLIRTKY